MCMHSFGLAFEFEFELSCEADASETVAISDCEGIADAAAIIAAAADKEIGAEVRASGSVYGVDDDGDASVVALLANRVVGVAIVLVVIVIVVVEVSAADTDASVVLSGDADTYL